MMTVNDAPFANAYHQLGGPNWLGEEVVGTCPQCFVEGVDVAQRGEKHDGRLLTAGQSA